MKIKRDEKKNTLIMYVLMLTSMLTKKQIHKNKQFIDNQINHQLLWLGALFWSHTSAVAILVEQRRAVLSDKNTVRQFIFWVLLQLSPSLFKQSSENIDKYLIGLLSAVSQVESAFVGQMNGLSSSPMLTLPRPHTIQEQHANSR